MYVCIQYRSLFRVRRSSSAVTIGSHIVTAQRGTVTSIVNMYIAFRFVESLSSPDETRLEEYLLSVPGIKTTPVANASQIINVCLNIDVRKLIALVNLCKIVGIND